MSRRTLGWTLVEASAAIGGTAVAFAFLEAGAFAPVSADTLHRMVAPESLLAAALGGGVTALLLLPALAWLRWRDKRTAGQSGPAD